MKKESFADGIRTLAEEGASVMVIRTKYEGGPRFASEILDRMGYECVVINAGDGANRHPTQAILNLFTIQQKLARHHNFILGFVGDLRYSRTIHSDLDMLKLLIERYGNIRIKAVSVPEATLLPWQKMGLPIEESDSIEFLNDCHIVSATRIQEERYTDKNELRKVLGRFSIDRRVLEDVLREDVIVMHPGPRGPEIAPEISEDPRIIMWEQMGTGVPTRMEIIHRCYMSRTEKVEPSDEEACDIKVIVEESVEDRLAKRKQGTGAHRYFMPIQEKGMVIDHLSLGGGDKVKYLLKKHAGLRGDEGCIHLHEGVKVAKGTSEERRKDVVVLEGQYIDEKFYGPIRFIEPGVTFNVIKGGMFTKIKAEMPKILSAGIFKCPNEMCINNNDPEGKARFRVQGSMAICQHCNRGFSREELLNNL